MARKSNSDDDLPSPQSSSMNEARKAVLDKALSDIVKRYGEGSIMRMGEATHMAVEAIPTGSLSLDIAPWVWAEYHAHVSPKFLGRNPLARPRFACISPPKPRSWVAQ